MKIDQIMRNFVSHKESHKDIKFDSTEGLYKMYYTGSDAEMIDVDLYEKEQQVDTVYDIISEEAEIPIEEPDKEIKLNFYI